MKTNAIIKYVYNAHVTDIDGVTISDVFTTIYESGAVRKFKCRNKVSKNVADFIKAHADKSKHESITDKYGKTHTSIIWE